MQGTIPDSPTIGAISWAILAMLSIFADVECDTGKNLMHLRVRETPVATALFSAC